MTDEQKPKRGRPAGTRKFPEGATGRYGRPEISVRLDPDLMEWVKGQGGAVFLRQIAEQARESASGPGPLEGRLQAAIELLDHHGLLALVEGEVLLDRWAANL